MEFRCKNEKCPSKGKPQEKIGVVSECTQTLHIKSDSWEDLEVGSTLYGYCLECSDKINPKTFRRIMNAVG